MNELAGPGGIGWRFLAQGGFGLGEVSGLPST